MRVARADQAPRQASYQANLIPFPRGDAAGQRATRRFDAERLRELRDWSLDRGLEALGLHFKRDASYVPRKADQRVHVSLASGQVVELVLTGIQWFDIAAKHGGGGVIDLAMHLMACDFVTAVRALRSAPS